MMPFAPNPAYRLPAAELRSLSEVQGWRTTFHLVAEWGSIVAVAWLCERFWSPAAYLLGVIWIGARLHALAVLAHDGAHFLLYRSRRRNDLLCQLFCAWPLFMSLQAYRRIHLKHHTHVNTPDDPDWARNRPDRLRTRHGTVELARILLGLSSEQRELMKFFTTREAQDGDAAARRLRAIRLAYYAAIVALFVYSGRPDLLLLYWLVPLFSWFLIAMRLKGIAEHFAVEDTDAANASRTMELSWLERTLFAPKNIHYHAEHHLYPTVPCHHLRTLHARLMQNPAYRERVHVTRGYLGMIRECARASADAAIGQAR
jgi:fatty acid desaturase